MICLCSAELAYQSKACLSDSQAEKLNSLTRFGIALVKTFLPTGITHSMLDTRPCSLPFSSKSLVMWKEERPVRTKSCAKPGLLTSVMCPTLQTKLFGLVSFLPSTIVQTPRWELGP